MTLPADIPVFVFRHIHSRNTFFTLRILRMAPPAKFARSWFAGEKIPWIQLVIFLRFMAADTGHISMVRDSFGAGD
jgi:hypothetical protein